MRGLVLSTSDIHSHKEADMTSDAASRREQSRRPTGQFGKLNHPHGQGKVTLTPSIPESVDLTGFQPRGKGFVKSMEEDNTVSVDVMDGQVVVSHETFSPNGFLSVSSLMFDPDDGVGINRAIDEFSSESEIELPAHNSISRERAWGL